MAHARQARKQLTIVGRRPVFKAVAGLYGYKASPRVGVGKF